MKLLILSIAFMTLVTCLKPINAGELSVQVIQSAGSSDSDTNGVSGWSGMQISYQPDDSELFFFVSKERMSVIAVDEAFNYNLTGLGAGIKKEVFKGINFFSQVGYYFVKNDWGKRRQLNEAMLYYLNNRYHLWITENDTAQKFIAFDEYEVKNDNAFGGAIGVEMVYPITKKLNASIMMSYRVLKIKQSISGYYDKWANDPNHFWTTGGKINYSSTNFGVGLNYSF